MYISLKEYNFYGYTAIPDNAFDKYAYNAEAIIRKNTFNRISDSDLRPDESADKEAKRIAEMNQRGVCEIMEALYAQDQVTIGEAGAAIKSVTNEGYSETLDTSRNGVTETRRKIRDALYTYFTPTQLYRGVK